MLARKLRSNRRRSTTLPVGPRWSVDRLISLASLLVTIILGIYAAILAQEIAANQEELTKPTVSLRGATYGLWDPDKVPGTDTAVVKPSPPFACAADYMVTVYNSGRSPVSIAGARPFKKDEPPVYDGSAETEFFNLDIAWFNYNGDHLGNSIPVVVPPGEYRYALVRMVGLASNQCLLAQFSLIDALGGAVPVSQPFSTSEEFSALRDKIYFSCTDGPLTCK